MKYRVKCLSERCEKVIKERGFSDRIAFYCCRASDALITAATFATYPGEQLDQWHKTGGKTVRVGVKDEDDINEWLNTGLIEKAVDVMVEAWNGGIT